MPGDSPTSPTKCTSCGALVFFKKTSSGRLMILDAKPVRRWIVVPQQEGPSIVQPVDTFETHFATCPNAAQHRKPREDKTT